MDKFVVLLSSGLDSTVNLAMAKAKGEVALALTFDYGQRARESELSRSRAICDRLNVPHKIVDVRWFSEFTQTSLVNHSSPVPVDESVQIDSFEQSTETAKSVWVPNRNGIFLNIAAGFAEGLQVPFIVPGFNLEEATTFPDNSEDFMSALDKSFYFSTATQVKVRCFTSKLSKTEIVRLGRTVGAPFDLVWPCYFGEARPCEKCESCKRFARAMREA